MKNTTSGFHQTVKRSAKSGNYVLTQSKGESISAVEGLSLTPRMRTTVQAASGRFLTSEQRRDLVKETLRKK